MGLKEKQENNWLMTMSLCKTDLCEKPRVVNVGYDLSTSIRVCEHIFHISLMDPHTMVTSWSVGKCKFDHSNKNDRRNPEVRSGKRKPREERDEKEEREGPNEPF